MLGVLWNASEAAQCETPICFQAKPSLLVFTQSRPFCSLEDSAPISEDSDPRMPGAHPAINHRRTATNTTLTQVFLFSPQRQCIFRRMNEHASYTALYQQISFRECFLLQKYSFLLPLHSILSQHTSPLLKNSGLPWG